MKRAVTIKPYRTNTGDIDFRMYVGNSKTPTDTLVFNKNDDKIHKSEFYQVHFTLENAPDTNLVFLQDAKNKQECMWVAAGNKSQPPVCPNGRSTHSEIMVEEVEDYELIVENQDMIECKYKFVLCFEDLDRNRKVVRYDPIYDNKNGGTTRTSASLSAGPIVIAVGAIALVGLLYLAMR